MKLRLQVDPQKAMKEFADFSARIQKGGALLDKAKDRDVAIATTAKREVFRVDKTVLYRYQPVTKATVGPPVLDFTNSALEAKPAGGTTPP